MYPVTADNIRGLHDELIRQSGGSSGVLSIGTLDHIAFECNRKQDVFTRAAVALHGVVTMHPFFDGNKRTGLALAYVILRGQGHKMQLDEENVIAFLLQVASYKLDVGGIEDWLRKNTVRA